MPPHLATPNVFFAAQFEVGAQGFGDVYTALPDYIRDNRVNVIHFRNISAPLPRFTETFLDDGYGDMYRLIRSIVRAGYDGSIILDHTPDFCAIAGGAAGATCFAVGWIKSAIRAAEFEMMAERDTSDAKL